ncbi:MAG: PAS domain S-box protein [Leptothrix sp. (in: b-proteobacteria)]
MNSADNAGDDGSGTAAANAEIKPATTATGLRESEQRFRLLAAATFEGIVVTEQGRVVDVNDQLLQMLGLSRAEMIGRPVIDFVPVEQRPSVLDNIVRGCASHIEHALICQDGRQIQVEARGQTLDGEGRKVRVTAVRDITDRKRAEALIRRSQQQLHNFIQQAPIRIAMFDRQMRYLAYSQRWLVGHGCESQNLVGRSHYEVHPDIGDEWKTVHRRGLAGETIRRDGDYWRHANGSEQWLRWVVVPWHDEAGEIGGILISDEDITATKQAQMQLEQVNAQLAARTLQAEEASAAKTRFLSSVTHELRTPLHTILGYVRQLRKNSGDDIDRQLAIVERSSTHLLKLINDLLEYNVNASRIETLHLDAVYLKKFVAHLAHVSRVLAEAGGNLFKVSLADDLPAAVLADEQRLLQVLQNLLGNAFKYTRNGRVTLRVERDDSRRRTTLDGSTRLRFVVEDTGVGIAPEDQVRIFEPFSRGATALEQPGLGLGLAIARQWVEAMGGELQVRSTPGRGSQFFFALDLPTADLRPSVVVPDGECETCSFYPALEQRLASAPLTLLVVDDIAENRMLLRDLCELWGHEALEAGDGETALDLCSRAAPRVDVVLTDQCMPGLSGWELLQRIRQRPDLAGLPVILISASAPQRPAGFPADIHFDLALGKPFDDVQLKCFLCQRVGAIDQHPVTSSCQQPGAHTAARTVLPAEEWLIFRNLLDLGRLPRMEVWAQGLAAKEASCTAFAAQVIDCCRTADLAALERLAEATVPAGGHAA